jgi:uncharacterized lipoprotein YehR (DUF1307 family)
MKKFLVRVPVIYYQYTHVEAETEEEARKIALDGGGKYDEVEGLQFVCIDDSYPEEWDVTNEDEL